MAPGVYRGPGGQGQGEGDSLGLIITFCCVGSGSNKAWGAHLHHLVNAIEKSMCDGDVAFLSNYVDSGVLCQQHCSCIPKCTKSLAGGS